jgi:uncharacterized protein with beta-barrel porin domain
MRRFCGSVWFGAGLGTVTGASVLAIGAAMIATPAFAQQVVVGSAQCPIVAGVASCEGNLSTGVTSQQPFGHAAVRTINIRNTTSPIAPTNGIFGIGADRSDGPLTINIADGTIINVFDNLAIAEPAQGVIALLRGGNALVIDSGATITSNGGGRGAGGPGAGIEGDAFGAGGSVTITNRGQITTNSTTHRSTGITGQLFTGANGNIAITNSGALFANSTATGERDNVVAGIFASDNGAATSSGLITVNNTGAITVRTDPNAANTLAGGNAAGIVTNGLSSDSNTTITNSGALDSQGQRANGIFAFTRGNVLTGDTSVVVNNTGTMRIDGTGSGILVQTQGEKVDVTVRNLAAGSINILNANGTNTPSTGILVLGQARTGIMSVENAATITTAGTGFSRGIGVTTSGAPAGGAYNLSIANTGNITLGTAIGQGLRIDATRDDAAGARITNSGAINLSATTNAASAGISINLGLAAPGTTVGNNIGATLTNSGAVTMGSGVGIFINADIITVNNSGAINTTGAFSDAVNLNGSGTGAISLTSSANIRAQGANSDAIAIYGTGSGATINLSGAAVQAPTGIANSENYVVRVAGDINTVLTPTNGTTLTGNLIFAGGNDRIDLAAGNRITGNIDLGAGNDALNFATGTYAGAISLGAGDDSLSITNFSLADASAIVSVDGGAGTDALNYRLADGANLTLPVAGLQITNVETFVQSGAATMTLTGTNAGFNSGYELRQGTLNQNAALANINLTTLAGTTLGMSGSVRNLTVGGTISPLGATSGIGVATVGGDFVFASTATYNVDLNASGASDQIAVTGRATLNGGTVRTFTASLQSAFAANTSYSIVTAAGGLTGTFGTLVNTDLPLLNLSLSYTPNAAILNIRQASVTAASIAQTYNQGQVAGIIDNTQTGATGDYRTVLDALIFSTTPQVLTALDTTSGEIHASVLASGLRQSRVISNAMRARLQAGTPTSEGGNRFGLWLAGGIVDGAIAADGNAARVAGDSQGLIFGGELAGASSSFVVGAAVGYAKSRVDVNARQSSARLDGWQAGAYGRFGTGGSGFTVSALGSYVSSDADTLRGITVNTINRAAVARYRVESFAVGGEARFGIPVGGSSWAVGPVAAVDYTSVRRAAFTETNAASLNLTGNRDSHNLTSFGVGGFANWQGSGSKFDLSVQYEQGDRNAAATRLSLQGAPASSFLVRSPVSVRNGMRIGLASELALGSGWGIGAGYRGRIAGSDSDHSAVMALIWRQ